MPPLTILLGCDTFHPNVNGAARFAERLAAGLIDRGHDVHIVAPAVARGRHGTFTEVIEGREMTVHRWPSASWPALKWVRFTWPWRARKLAPRVLEEIKPDVVHVQSHIMGGRYLIRAAHAKGIRLVATNHTMPENIAEHTGLPRSLNAAFINWGWKDADRLLMKVQRVTTPTANAARYLEEHTSLTDVLPVSNGIAASHYSPDLTPRSEHRIIFVGRLEREKEVDVLIKAIALLPEDLDVHFDLVGAGIEMAHLKDVAAKHGVQDRVVFHGAIDDETLRGLYSRASLFAIASIAELQSIATMEAMASALPVVAANAMALPHLVDDGVNGYLFEPGDEHQAADRIERVLRLSHEDRVAMQKASLAGVAVHSLEHTLDVFEALYRDEPVPVDPASRNSSRPAADTDQS